MQFYLEIWPNDPPDVRDEMMKSVQIRKHLQDLQQVICVTFEVPTLRATSEENDRHVNKVCALQQDDNKHLKQGLPEL